MLTVYTKNDCPMCERAKQLLESKQAQYRLINIEDDGEAKEYLLEQGLRSVPQVFDGTTLIQGGYQGLATKESAFWVKHQNFSNNDLGTL